MDANHGRHTADIIIAKLYQFHMKCLRRIARIRWQDMLPNTAVLECCGVMGIEAMLTAAQLRWTGHIVRMDDSRIPKRTFYGQLAHGTRTQGGQYKRYKDNLKSNMKACGIPAVNLEVLAAERSEWRGTCREAVERSELQRIALLKEKRQRRKAKNQRAGYSQT